MSEHPVVHSTFTIERSYQATLDRVFGAWAIPEEKAKWFATPDAEHQLDFRVGGCEMARATNGEGAMVTFESTYHDIVPQARIVFSSRLSVQGKLATVSITTVEISAAGEMTKLVLTEQGTFLDGLEQPDWREEGTGQQLDALGAQLK